jgi:CHAT domain-containing protein
MTATRLRSLTASLGAPGTAVRGEDPARVLYDVLVKPVEPWLPAKTGGRITIVPHGPLFALPFAALRDPQGRYLIERWAPHYATSMSVLDRLESRPAGHSAGVLVVAEPTLDASLHRHEGLAPLPAARKEAEAVLRRLPLAPATTLTGPEATPAAVRQAAESRSVVHFATHAVVSDTRPLESFLALAPGDGNDGRLTSAEVYGWRLRADLVVLSACRTARGRVNGTASSASRARSRTRGRLRSSRASGIRPTRPRASCSPRSTRSGSGRATARARCAWPSSTSSGGCARARSPSPRRRER